jgi:DNA-binding winged helix-turn-helix (wHTH) protein
MDSIMERHFGSLSFGDFCLEIRRNPYIPNEVHRILYRASVEVELEPLPLKLLECLARRPKEPLEESYLSMALRRDASDEGKNIQHHIHTLRAALGDMDRDNRRFIANIPTWGYKFLADVRRQGDVGGIEAFLTWDHPRFFELLSRVERHGDEKEDLRIVTVAFSGGVTNLHLEKLLARNARIRIVMMNPENRDLLKARHGLRRDPKTPEKGRSEIEEQLEELAGIMAEYPTLEVRLSDAMPGGFVAHSKDWALTGMFLAHCSYVKGPMIEVSADTETWKHLYTDWFVRWEAAKPR